jgi:hypothetical protein
LPEGVQVGGGPAPQRVVAVELQAALLAQPVLVQADAPTFEVSSPALAWLTESLFVGTGARFPDRVEMRFFRVV